MVNGLRTQTPFLETGLSWSNEWMRWSSEFGKTDMREFSAPEIADLVELQRTAFLRDGPPSVEVRRDRIDRLSALTFENADAIAEAIRLDFGSRSAYTSKFLEIMVSIRDVANIRRNVAKWMKPRTVMGFTRPLGITTRVQAQPLGVVGIIAPWNGPVLLLTQPATAALAAGNRVILKASETTPHTASLLAELAEKYFRPEELAVVTGGPTTGAAFASTPFDHLLFTGSPQIAKHVQRAAAENLVPVTLELGGKNPVVVARDADLATAAQRVARARVFNGGQVCVCPDYVFVPSDRLEEFVAGVEREFRRAFPTILGNPDYCSIVDDKNYKRVVGLIEDARDKGATVVSATPAGEALPSPMQRCIAPTVLTGVNDEMDVMHEEVFGPVLSVLPYERLNDVIDYVNARPSPLAAYWYGGNTEEFRTFCSRTRNGGITRNDCGLHALIPEAPFGGVGRSGSGAYHGKAGFDAFSHYRTVSESRLPASITALALPPVPRLATKSVDWILRTQSRRLRKRIDRFERERL